MLQALTGAKPKRKFKAGQQISPHLSCPICQDIFEDPVRVICGHTFCYICIENWAVISKKCPFCRNSLKGRKLEKDFIAAHIIDDLIAECTHEGCSWEGTYAQLKKHLRWCEFKPRRELPPINLQSVVVIEGPGKEEINLDSEPEEEAEVEVMSISEGEPRYVSQ